MGRRIKAAPDEVSKAASANGGAQNVSTRSAASELDLASSSAIAAAVKQPDPVKDVTTALQLRRGMIGARGAAVVASGVKVGFTYGTSWCGKYSSLSSQSV